MQFSFAYPDNSNELAPHFEIEYEYIFPILGMENELVKKALTLNRRIKKIYQKDEN